MQIHSTKLALLHRWSGRLIWFIALLHVILWSVQLATYERLETKKSAYTYVWLYDKFIFGWIVSEFYEYTYPRHLYC